MDSSQLQKQNQIYPNFEWREFNPSRQESQGTNGCDECGKNPCKLGNLE